MVLIILPECTGDDPLGLESGYVLNQKMTAFSSKDKFHAPFNARLNRVAARGRKGAWSAKNNNADQWLKVDFRHNVKITRIATQGRQDADQWVRRYTLSYSADGGSMFQTYQENSVNKVSFNIA